jgi:hypothetical protein
MKGLLDTAGERLGVECELPWVWDLLAEGSAGQLRMFEVQDASLRVTLEATRRPFDTRGWPLLTRGAWARDGEVVMRNVCTSGFDLHLRATPEHANFSFRWRPPRRDRAAGLVLRSRFHLLARAALVQYPALWWAGTRGRAPLHASACTVGSSIPLLTAPSGVGRSTLVLEQVAAGECATDDNLGVGDGTTVWGLAEPLRVEGGDGRRMPHGRREAAMPGRVGALVPDRLVVLERGPSDQASLTPCGVARAARSLATSTYMAGELRRYWAFAATLAAGTDVGPGCSPVAEVASAFADRLPCFALTFGRTGRVRLAQLLAIPQEVSTCA